MNSAVSAQLRALRQTSGLTQCELAQLCGVSQAHISDCERGKYSGMNLASIEKWAAACGHKLRIEFDKI